MLCIWCQTNVFVKTSDRFQIVFLRINNFIQIGQPKNVFYVYWIFQLQKNYKTLVSHSVVIKISRAYCLPFRFSCMIAYLVIYDVCKNMSMISIEETSFQSCQNKFYIVKAELTRYFELEPYIILAHIIVGMYEKYQSFRYSHICYIFICIAFTQERLDFPFLLLLICKHKNYFKNSCRVMITLNMPSIFLCWQWYRESIDRDFEKEKEYIINTLMLLCTYVST